MKIVKYLGMGAGIVFVLFFMISILLPNSYHVTRSLEIKAPAKMVFAELSDYKNWDHWSPWLQKDSTIVNTYEGQAGAVGHKMSWTSKKSGTGSLTITGSYPNDSLMMDLEFKDFSMISHTFFILEPKGENIKVTWRNEGELKFFSRFFGLMMDKMEGDDFEHGLANIKKYCESKPKSSEMKIEAVAVQAQHILTVRQKCTPAEIGKMLGKLYGEIGVQMSMQGLKQAGAPFAIYHSYSKEVVDMEAGVPVDKPGKSVAPVSAGELKSGNAVKADYYGPYEGLEGANKSIKDWIASNNKKITGSPWESYVTDPTTVKDPSAVLTQVFYPVE